MQGQATGEWGKFRRPEWPLNTAVETANYALKCLLLSGKPFCETRSPGALLNEHFCPLKARMASRGGGPERATSCHSCHSQCDTAIPPAGQVPVKRHLRGTWADGGNGAVNKYASCILQPWLHYHRFCCETHFSRLEITLAVNWIPGWTWNMEHGCEQRF